VSNSHYVTGLRAVEQLLATPGGDVRKLYVEYKSANPRVAALIELAKSQEIETQPANRARLTQMSGESRHQGIVAEVSRSSVLDEGALRTLVENRLVNEQDGPLMLLVLDGIQDTHNLGACLRTADAAGVDAVVVPRHGAVGLTPTVSKIAAGAAESVPFATVGNIGRVLNWLADYGITLVGTSDAGSESLFDADLSGPIVFVMGREQSGLRKSVADRCDLLVNLPMRGSVQSLNVSVATGICLYEAVRQRRADK